MTRRLAITFVIISAALIAFGIYALTINPTSYPPALTLIVKTIIIGGIAWTGYHATAVITILWQTRQTRRRKHYSIEL